MRHIYARIPFIIPLIIETVIFRIFSFRIFFHFLQVHFLELQETA
jgi:hypothetical protein